MSNIIELFRKRFLNSIDKPFLKISEQCSYSFGDIDSLACAYAAVLREKGLIEGERVLVYVEKTPQAVALYLAVLQLGSVYVPINPSYTETELEYFIDDSEPRIVVCDPIKYSKILPICANAKTEPSLLCLGEHTNHAEQDNDLGILASDIDPYIEVHKCTEDDIAAFLYTSGTTGRSKGTMLSHGNIRSNALTLHKYWQFEPNDVLLHALPIFHIHGLFVALHCAILNASTVLFLNKFDTDQVIDSLSNATVFMGVPTFYSRLLANSDFRKEHCQNIRLFISGSAPMTTQVHKEWEELTEHRILERYGMTEAGMITSNPYIGERIPGTVGHPLPEVSVRITDDQGIELENETIGNIEVSGPNVFQGYWKMPEKTSQEFREDGYFITGDLGKKDENGRISITGRKKDLIISGGYNVYPKEIEILIDSINGVLESAVIGLEDKDYGESVCAIVVLKNTMILSKADILDVISSNLASYKRPKSIFFIDKLPKNVMGKVQKNVLRKQFFTI